MIVFWLFSLTVYVGCTQWRAEGGANGAPAPGIQGRGGIQKVQLQKFKCCNYIIFPVESLLIGKCWMDLTFQNLFCCQH